MFMTILTLGLFGLGYYAATYAARRKQGGRDFVDHMLPGDFPD